MESDTIVAISTPPGRGAIGVIRLSGPESWTIAASLTWRKALRERRISRVTIRSSSGEVLDDALVSPFRGPSSYTGEDMVELSCHGNPVILERIVGEALAAGARAARAGEFTLRAFVNGKLDLSQAEAVVDLVEARTEAGAGLALRQLEGELSKRVEPLRSRLLDLLAHMTALVDFSEECIPEVVEADILAQLEHARGCVESLLRGAHQGQILSHGVSLAIVGPPNAGKSSILNRLLRRERAIVTPIAGTTRDTLEEDMQLDGILFRLVDTAGFVQTSDVIEALGIERSRRTLESADLVLVVLDGSKPLEETEQNVLGHIRSHLDGRRPIVALNKSDLTSGVSAEMVDRLMSPADVVRTCALTDDGIAALTEVLPQRALGGPIPDGFVLSNQRHIHALHAVLSVLTRAIAAQQEGLPLDLITYDVREACECLGAVLGVGIGDEVLDRVFSRFCIGK